MRKEDINILKLKLKNNYIKKNEVKTYILKSIVQNRKLPPIYQNYASMLLARRSIKMYKFKHICLKNNKASSVYNSFYLSKYALKESMYDNKTQALRINSW